MVVVPLDKTLENGDEKMLSGVKYLNEQGRT